MGGGRTVGRTQNGGILGVRPKVLVFYVSFLSVRFRVRIVVRSFVRSFSVLRGCPSRWYDSEVQNIGGITHSLLLLHDSARRDEIVSFPQIVDQ